MDRTYTPPREIPILERWDFGRRILDVGPERAIADWAQKGESGFSSEESIYQHCRLATCWTRDMACRAEQMGMPWYVVVALLAYEPLAGELEREKEHKTFIMKVEERRRNNGPPLPEDTSTNGKRRAILDSGMSRYQICKTIGLDQGSMSKFMHGERGLSMEVLEKLADLLDLEIVVRKRGKR
ncbi:MAG: helix-turn-helix transcriptional regulator [Planctomycetota bacterium]|nr:helix-turn-helix transcriptional regulator [Planctomycetota bacterium]